jgi:hypothetical protein
MSKILGMAAIAVVAVLVIALAVLEYVIWKNAD